MNWSYKIFSDYCVIDLPQNIFEPQNIEELKILIKDLSENECGVFFLNMNQIPRACSRSLGQIINIYKFAASANVEIKLYNLHPYVSQLIFQTRLNMIFDICTPDSEFITDHHQELYLSQACCSSFQ